MIIVNGTIVSIVVTYKDLEADPPVLADTATITIDPADLVVPNTATGGLAAGPCRIMVESA